MSVAHRALSTLTVSSDVGNLLGGSPLSAVMEETADRHVTSLGVLAMGTFPSWVVIGVTCSFIATISSLKSGRGAPDWW